MRGAKLELKLFVEINKALLEKQGFIITGNGLAGHRQTGY
jgi:hypothetical protein